LTTEEAQGIINGLNPEIKVLHVEQSPVCGLWLLVLESQGKKGVVYMDFARKNLVQGNILDIKRAVSARKEASRTLDVSRIPTKDAILVGKADAPYKVIVFDDPD
jgi:thiol:disulfide interchange protein DsbC